MKKLIAAGALILAMAVGTSAFAQEVAVGTAPPDAAGAYKPFVVGAYMGMGMAHSMVDADGDYFGDAKPRFAGGGGAYFDFYLMEMLALEAGVDFIGKGYRTKNDDDWTRTKFIYMEIPLGAKLNIHNFRIGAAVALSFALSGKTKWEVAGHEDDDSWGGDDWDNYRRFNLVPRIWLGYAIPVGPIAIVPGLAWEIEILNTATGDLADDADGKWHNMNLMFTAAVEFGFGSK